MVAETVSACARLIGLPFRPVYTRVAVCFDILRDCCPQCRFTRVVLKIAVLSALCPGGAPGQGATEPLSSIVLPFFVI